MSILKKPKAWVFWRQRIPRVMLMLLFMQDRMDDGVVAFIMAEGLSYRNVCVNPKAAYLFVENGEGYKGKRLYLTKTGEQTDQQVIDSMRRRDRSVYQADKGKSSLVHFKVEKIRTLVGDDVEQAGL